MKRIMLLLCITMTVLVIIPVSCEKEEKEEEISSKPARVPVDYRDKWCGAFYCDAKQKRIDVAKVANTDSCITFSGTGSGSIIVNEQGYFEKSNYAMIITDGHCTGDSLYFNQYSYSPGGSRIERKYACRRLPDNLLRYIH